MWKVMIAIAFMAVACPGYLHAQQQTNKQLMVDTKPYEWWPSLTWCRGIFKQATTIDLDTDDQNLSPDSPKALQYIQERLQECLDSKYIVSAADMRSGIKAIRHVAEIRIAANNMIAFQSGWKAAEDLHNEKEKKQTAQAENNMTQLRAQCSALAGKFDMLQNSQQHLQVQLSQCEANESAMQDVISRSVNSAPTRTYNPPQQQRQTCRTTLDGFDVVTTCQ